MILGNCLPSSGADPGFQVRGGALKKNCAEQREARNFWGISCEKSRFYAKKSYFFFNCRGRREHFWGISCEKSRFYAKKKNHIFSNFRGGGRAPGAHPLNPPLIMLRPFGFLVPKRLLNYLTFIYFDLIKDYSRLSTFLFTILPNMNVNLKPGAAARNKK